MIKSVPFYIQTVFILTTFLAIFCFYRSLPGRKVKIILFVFVYMILQGLLSGNGFYLKTNALPPHFPLLILPVLVLITVVFLSSKGKSWLDGLDNTWLTLLHIVRIPVEMILHSLFIYSLVPQLMTYEGVNFDIISGITAPFIVYFGYMKNKLGRKVLLIWNLVCLGLLLNIVIRAILAVPGPLQTIAFDQPNTGVLYFPFTWLPSIIVPLVLFSHLVCIRSLIIGKSGN